MILFQYKSEKDKKATREYWYGGGMSMTFLVKLCKRGDTINSQEEITSYPRNFFIIVKKECFHTVLF